jgi:large subunit ribosomal protein L24
MKKNNKITKRHIKTGDTVKVIAGDEKGNSGKVLRIVTETNRVFIEGLNIVKKHQKPSAQNTNGGIVEKEASIHISNVMLVDSATGMTTRVGRKLNKEGKLQRFSKKTGNFIK